MEAGGGQEGWQCKPGAPFPGLVVKGRSQEGWNEHVLVGREDRGGRGVAEGVRKSVTGKTTDVASSEVGGRMWKGRGESKRF